MAEINQVDVLVKVEAPAVVDNQQLMVYIPVANYANGIAGVVKPNTDDFIVEADGTLKLNPDGTYLLSKVDVTNEENKLYGTDSNGNQTLLNYSETNIALAVAKRDDKGAIHITTTSDADSAVNVKYFSEALDNSLEEQYNRIIGETGNIIDEAKDTAEKALIASKDALNAAKEVEDTKYKLNNIEAQLNENIIKNPEKTYFVFYGNNFPASTSSTFKAPAGSIIDWGDGSISNFDKEDENVTSHTYTDGFEYHIISISKVYDFINSAFENTNIQKVYLSNKITQLKQSVFKNCLFLNEVIINHQLSSIQNSCFENTRITNFKCDVTQVLFSAFRYCNKLETVDLNTTYLGDAVFKDCTSLTELDLSRSSAKVTAYANTLPSTIKKILVPKSLIKSYKSSSPWVSYYSRIFYKVTDSSTSISSISVTDNQTVDSGGGFCPYFVQGVATIYHPDKTTEDLDLKIWFPIVAGENISIRKTGMTLILSSTASGGSGDFDAFGLAQGDKKYSIVQKRLSDAYIDGTSTDVTPEYTNAYQYGSSSYGGACQSGMTETEFNNFYWDSTTQTAKNGGQGLKDGKVTDYTGRTYDKSRNYAVSFGGGNKSLGRDSFTANNSNYTEALFSSVFGYNNKVTNIQPYSFTAGRYNLNKTGLYFSIGNGTSDANRSNILEAYSNRVLSYGEGTEDYDVVNFNLGNKHYRRILPNVLDDTLRIYAKINNSDTSIVVKQDTTGSSIPYRSSTGQIKASAAIEDTDVVNKHQLQEGLNSISGGIQYVTITPNTAVKGTLTEAQMEILDAQPSAIIVLNNEYYRLADRGHEGTDGIWSYVHVGWDGSAIQDKSINITVNTFGWVLVVGVVPIVKRELTSFTAQTGTFTDDELEVLRHDNAIVKFYWKYTDASSGNEYTYYVYFTKNSMSDLFYTTKTMEFSYLTYANGTIQYWTLTITDNSFSLSKISLSNS